MDKLKLEHLAPYLPYGVKVKTGATVIRELVVEMPKDEEIRKNVPIQYVINGMGHSLILRPLGDLFKWVDYGDGHGLVQLGYKYSIVKDDDEYCEAYNADQCESPQAYVPLSDYNFWLFEKHFDVFGLIEKGLAIDINMLESEVKND